MGAALAQTLPVAAGLAGLPLDDLRLRVGLPTMASCAPAAALTPELLGAFARCSKEAQQVWMRCVAEA